MGVNTLEQRRRLLMVQPHLATKSGSIVTVNAIKAPAKKIVAAVTPVQDLHGQESPYPAGCGKNKCPMTLTGMKTLNTTGTWNGNVYSINGISFTVETDDGGNVTGIKTGGVPSATTVLFVASISNSSETFKMNGCPAGGGATTNYKLDIIKSPSGYVTNGTDTGKGTNAFTLESDGTYSVRIIIYTSNPSSSLTFKPMIRLSTETDANFATYSNLCPISGWDSANITGTGANLATFTDGTSTISGATVAISNGIISLNGTTNNMLQIRSGAFTVVPGDSLTLSGCPYGGDPTTYRIDIRLASDASLINVGYDTGSGLTFTVPTGVTSIIICVRIVSGVNVSGLVFKPVIGKTSERTVTPITFPSTVYGGTVKVNKDGSRKLIASYAIYDLGDSTWSYQNEGYMRGNGIEGSKPPSGNNVKVNAICSALPVYTATNIYNGTTGFGMMADSRLRVRYPGMSTDPDTFKSDVTGWKLVYELATPVEIDLTDLEVISLLNGVNNLWADVGDISVTCWEI